MNLDYRVTMIRMCFSIAEQEEGVAMFVDASRLKSTLRNFAECDWDAGADGQRDALANPHRREA